ncbi:MAG TPA: hypothetical protein VGS07_15885 [Thermoanaerobaculia bacterium]|jgi:hypothetical protein|nr:hypothetical protein [Thermoanaerobaculia bacterium]
MSLSERIQLLNQAIGSSVERSIAELREEISQRLRSSSEEIQRRVEEIVPRLPASFLSHEDFAPHEREVGSTARQTAFSDLRDGIAAVDRARTQADILTALLRESSRHASRAALLLVRGGELRGWGSEGFGDAGRAVRELALNPQEGAWSQLLNSEGALRLSAAECAELCSRIEAPLPQGGVLIPLVLRDRVAAGLYADRLDEAGLDVEALQILAHTAALGIETLPFRERAETPTLNLAGGKAVSTATAPAAPAPAEAVPAAASAPEAREEMDALKDVPELEVEPEPEPATEAEPAPGAPWTAEDEQSAVSLDATDVSQGSDLAEDTAPAVPGVASWQAEEPAATSSRYTAELSLDSIAAASSAATQTSPLATQRAAASDAMTEDVPRYPRSVEPEAPTPAPQPKDASPDATVLLQRSALPLSEPAPPTPPPAPLRPVPAPEPAPFERPATATPTAGTPEVRPPSGVDGPGWAFATTRVPVSPSEEALHEEARRLARLLVSEIKLYNEEQVEEGRRNRDIYERLKEDIDRSRQMYDERVDPKILRSTDYFYQELVRILASGDSRALGI